MTRHLRPRNLSVVFIALYVLFVFFYGKHTRRHWLEEMKHHAMVIEEDIWTLSPEGSAAYLTLAAARDNYDEITVRDVSGKDIITIAGPGLADWDLFLEHAGLLPQSVMAADIKHDGQMIGRLICHHRNKNVYVYFLSGVILALGFLALVLFVKTIASKHDIEQRVRERTAELTSEMEERKRVTKALQKSEERFQYAMSATKDGLWDWDVVTDETYFSPGYYTILGYEPESITITKQMWRQYIHPDDRDATLQAYADCIENRTEDFEVEFRMLTQSGDWKWILCRGRAVDRDNASRALRLVGTYIDITGRKQAEEERRKLEAALQRSEKMELVGTLAGGVAHDLNNILGAIVGYPDILIEKMRPDDPMRDHLAAIKESGERAALIVQDLLTLARRGVAIAEPENLNQIVERYLKSRELSKLQQTHPQVVIETHLAPDLKNIVGSQVHLSKVIMNLCSNALEAMPGGGKLTISTENVYLDRPIKEYDHIENGEYIVLTVSDEGVGISQNDLKRIFEPFYSKKVMGKSGTGLGMAVVWGTVKDHRGYIDVTSEEGIGTTFKVYFPVMTKAAHGRHTPEPIDKMIGNRESILVIDDVEEQRTIAVNLLTRLNYSVSSASSGEEAIELLKQRPFDLLILDMLMEPGIDGLETYQRTLELHPGQRAILTSGFSETKRVRQALRLGAGQYLKKPYTLENLGKAVKRELSRKPGEAKADIEASIMSTDSTGPVSLG